MDMQKHIDIKFHYVQEQVQDEKHQIGILSK